jgi:hypothetical protein
MTCLARTPRAARAHPQARYGDSSTHSLSSTPESLRVKKSLPESPPPPHLSQNLASHRGQTTQRHTAIVSHPRTGVCLSEVADTHLSSRVLTRLTALDHPPPAPQDRGPEPRPVVVRGQGPKRQATPAHLSETPVPSDLPGTATRRRTLPDTANAPRGSPPCGELVIPPPPCYELVTSVEGASAIQRARRIAGRCSASKRPQTRRPQ